MLDANNVKKCKKGLFKLRPPRTKYHAIWDINIDAIWDINIVLNFLENMSTDNDTYLSRKLVCLFMLLSISRVKSISHLKITNMYMTDTECTFIFDDVLKHSRPSFKEKPLVFRAFLENLKLCPVSPLIQYLDIRLSRSSDTALFLTTFRPYKGVSSDTIAHWRKTPTQEVGINNYLFSPHSCRSAATSKAIPALQ